jgi:CBS domain-containing protein/sporulation protein YlmC with PRC-barrel domain
VTEPVYLSLLLRRRIVDRRGEVVGRLSDVVVRLRGEAYPLVIGLVARVARRDVFLPQGAIGELTAIPLQLRQAVDLRRFERRDGEVLLRADVLRHRLIDIAEARLVRAWDVELARTEAGWSVRAVDTGRPRRFFGLLRGEPAPHDWKSFEPLIGHAASARLRGRFGRVTRLKPAQIADLLEGASQAEGTEILGAVHADPELEADVYEEIDEDLQARLFGAQTDAQVAEVLARMQPDDAADAVAELPQSRRQPILDLLPAGQRTKVLMLLGFNPSSAGGLMSVDFLSVPAEATVNEALERIRAARNLQPEVLTSVHALDDGGRLAGVARLTRLLQTSPTEPISSVAESDPVHVHPEADVVDLALLMSDYNLVTVPVVDENHQMLGVVTVDDVLEATIPEDWRRREPPEHPEGHTPEQPPDAEAAAAEKPNSPVP